MQKSYCTECGLATEYSLNKPKMCAFCGTPFNSISTRQPANLPPTSPPTKAQPATPFYPAGKPTTAPAVTDPHSQLEVSLEGTALEVSIDGDNDPIVIDSANAMDVDIVTLKPNKVNLMDIACRNPGPPVDLGRKVKGKVPKISKKQILEDFAKEAGAIKPQSRSHKNNV